VLRANNEKDDADFEKWWNNGEGCGH